MIFQVVFIVIIAAVASALPFAEKVHAPVNQGEHYVPQPYKFGYSVKDKHGEQHREESGDGGHGVKGSYGFTDARGIHRQVNYVADKAGFRAQVKTNEPGTANQNPAAVQVVSDAYGAGAAELGNPEAVLGYAAVGNVGAVPVNVGVASGYEAGNLDIGSVGVGIGNMGVGLGNVGVGLGNVGVGLGNVGVGLGNVGVGNVGVGLGNVGVGVGNLGVGLGNIGASSEYVGLDNSGYDIGDIANNGMLDNLGYARYGY